MNRYDTPKMDLIYVAIGDVITTSGEDVLLDASSLESLKGRLQ